MARTPAGGLSLFARDALMGPCVRCGLRDLSVCCSLGDADLSRFTGLMQELTIPAGGSLFAEGAPAYHAFAVTRGVVKLSRGGRERRRIAGFLGRGDVIGLATGKTYGMSADAVSDLSVCRFPRDRLNQMTEELPNLQHCLFERASGERACLEEPDPDDGPKSPAERLASFLVAELARAERRGGADGTIDLVIAREDLADYLGLTTDAVGRALDRLKREGMIGLDRSHRLRILRRAALAELAGSAE